MARRIGLGHGGDRRSRHAGGVRVRVVAGAHARAESTNLIRPAELPARFEIDNKDGAFLYSFHGQRRGGGASGQAGVCTGGVIAALLPPPRKRDSGVKSHGRRGQLCKL